MKILFACEIFPPDIGGPATYVERMAGEMIKDGHEILVLTYSDQSTLENDKNYSFKVIRIPRVKNLLKRYLSYTYNLYKLSKDFDLIYAQGPVPSGLPSVIVKKLTGKIVVAKVVGDFIWERSRNVYGLSANIDDFQKQKYPFKIKILRWLQKTVLNQTNQVIVPSNYLKKIVSGWGVKSEKIKVIYNAVEKVTCPLTKEQAKADFGLSGDIIISIGRLAPWKGFSVLIKIFPQILQINPNFKLLIVGPGPEKDNLEKLINDLNLNDKIILTGHKDHCLIPQYLRTAEFFILNTGYEGLSHQLVECLMMETPIITTNIGGNPEVVDNGHNGLLFEYNNEEQIIASIRKLWEDKTLREKFVNNSQSSLHKFQFENMYKETLATLKAQL